MKRRKGGKKSVPQVQRAQSYKISTVGEGKGGGGAPVRQMLAVRWDKKKEKNTLQIGHQGRSVTGPKKRERG